MNILIIISFILLCVLISYNINYPESFENKFVHIPKTAGSSIAQFLSNYDIDILGHDHNANIPNAIIVIRHPIDRFISTFKYWKKLCIHEQVCDNSVHLKDFIEYIKTDNEKMLISPHYQKWHYLPQSNYIDPSNYKNTIIVKYSKNMMNTKMKILLKYLNIPDKGIELPSENLSLDFYVHLDNVDLEWIYMYYQKDFDLYNKLNNPELFKLVI
jgi:hypothetical protein